MPEVELVLRRQLERAPHRLAGATHALRIARRDADDTQVVQHPLGAHGAAADAVLHHVVVAVRMVVQAVRREDHLVVLVERVAAERERGVGAAADHVRHAGQLQHVGHVPAAAALDVERVDGAPGQHRQCVLHAEALVQPVGVQGHLHVELLGHVQRGVERTGVRAHVLVHLEADGAALHQCLHQRRRVAGRPTGQEPDVHGPLVEAVERVPQRPRRVHAHTPHGPELLADDGGDTRGE